MSEPAGRWVVVGETTVWRGGYVDGAVADVVSPSGARHTYEVVRARFEGAAAMVVNDASQVLLAWRHRFIPDTWGWELPAGGLQPGEDPVWAAARELTEETGWELLNPRLVWSMWRCPERSNHRGHLVIGRAGRRVGDPDRDEAAELAWFDPPSLRGLLLNGQVGDVFTAAASWWWLAGGDVPAPSR